MTRRTIGFLVTLALSLLMAPPASDAQPPIKVHRIGRLSAFSTDDANAFLFLEAFRQGLRELGYVEGQNLVLEARWAERNLERIPVLVNELIRLQVEVIMAAGDVIVQAAQQATRTIPIVMACTSDPVGQGFVASLARPGGNITGLSCFNEELSGKRLQLFKELAAWGQTLIEAMEALQALAAERVAAREVEEPEQETR
jgi:putative tryptophan/tyrosine transport system substrate-binding protein